MSDHWPDLTVRLHTAAASDGRKGWPFIPLDVAGRLTLQMVPNLLSPRSTISPTAVERLRQTGLSLVVVDAIHPRGKKCVLNGLAIDGVPVPDVETWIRRQAGLLGGDGYLGLDFFGSYAEICFRPDELVLTLRGGR